MLVFPYKYQVFPGSFDLLIISKHKSKTSTVLALFLYHSITNASGMWFPECHLLELPRIARAEDLVVGAGRVAKDAMKDTARETQSWNQLRVSPDVFCPRQSGRRFGGEDKEAGLWWRYIWMMLDENEHITGGHHFVGRWNGWDVDWPRSLINWTS
jgi:hypothetical protein